ncbi:hypothetical protein [Hoeflea sp. IMCC20628]|uniref:hypothetical protein n=1 Tax=Hoeflea sp. IMCC20628 TaxID=1620421 RepID=UPI000AECE127|nr:hypothetical protein [Hoeflea sp. IMCC20628]
MSVSTQPQISNAIPFAAMLAWEKLNRQKWQTPQLTPLEQAQPEERIRRVRRFWEEGQEKGKTVA